MARASKFFALSKNQAKQVNLRDPFGGLAPMSKLAYENNLLLNPKDSVLVYTWGWGLFIGCMICTLTARVSLSTSERDLLQQIRD
jgi:hypothetical protein